MATVPVFKPLRKDELTQVLTSVNIKLDEKTQKSKTQMLRVIHRTALDSGIKALITQLKTVELEEMVKPHKDVDTGSGRKVVLQKRLAEKIAAEGVREFFSQYSEKFLTNLLKIAGYPASKDKESMVATLDDEIEFQGLTIFLSTLPITMLKKIAALTVSDENVDTLNTRNSLLKAIAYGKVVKSEKKPAKTVYKKVKTKKPIKPGVTYNEIYQKYKADELQEWCKDHGISSTGRKKEIIKRILAFIAEKPGNYKKIVKREDKKKTRSASPKASSKKKKVKAAKKAEEKEEMSEESSEEEEEQVASEKPVEAVEEPEEAGDDEEEEEDEEREPAEEIDEPMPEAAAPADEAAESEESSEEEAAVSSEMNWEGKVVCVTGAFPMSRAEMTKKIKTLGATISKTVTKATTHLIASDVTQKTQKMIDAAKNGVVILSWEDVARYF